MENEIVEMHRDGEKLFGYELLMISEVVKSLEKLYRESGFISLDIRSYGPSGVHLSKPALQDTFSNWEVEERWSGSHDKLTHELDGVEYYAIEYVERPEPEVEEEPQQSNLPALQMTPKKIDVITMLIDFYRLRQNPDKEMDAFLTRLRSELSAAK